MPDLCALQAHEEHRAARPCSPVLPSRRLRRHANRPPAARQAWSAGAARSTQLPPPATAWWRRAGQRGGRQPLPSEAAVQRARLPAAPRRSSEAPVWRGRLWPSGPLGSLPRATPAPKRLPACRRRWPARPSPRRAAGISDRRPAPLQGQATAPRGLGPAAEAPAGDAAGRGDSPRAAPCPSARGKVLELLQGYCAWHLPVATERRRFAVYGATPGWV